MARIVIVSNRVPTPGRRGVQPGGLAAALGDSLRPGTLWFGWSGRVVAETPARAELVEHRGVAYAMIDLSEADYRRFYAGFANGALWPLLHARLGLMEFERADLEGYVAVNRAFAAALAPLLRPDDLVWVHDYHLIPLGAELRALGVQNRLGFFLHVPFVPASIFGVLPCADLLLRALMAYDLVGVQSEQHRRDLRNAMDEILGARAAAGGRIYVGEQSTRIIANPIGIDAAGFTALAERAAGRREAKRLAESLVGRALIIGADRLDYSKGLPNRFEGFARFLHRYPVFRQKVSYLQVAALSRADVKQYQALRRELDRLAGDINGRFAEFDWVPLRYMTSALPRATLAGFYRMARVGLVTPLRDGMNLVAKEYVAAQDPRDPGVLILSKFAGAAERMGDALIINPYDADSITDAIARALTMPLAERQRRFETLSHEVRTVTAQSFYAAFCAALAGTPVRRLALAEKGAA